MRRLALPVLLLVLFGGLLVRDSVRQAGGDHPSSVSVGRVVRVVDGDTIRVDLGGREERVRYIGVDTPESVKPGTPVQCFAKKASALNARLVAGQRVRLVRDVEERDRYGRLLAYVYPADGGPMVNETLVARGYARTLTIPPNVRFATRFRRLATAAREHGRGLWRAC